MSDLLSMFNELDDSEEVREQYARAPFGYPGGKSKSVKYILPHLPYRNAYIEPFGGSGVVLLNRKESRLEIFNDRYAGVVAFYRCLRDQEKMNRLIDRCEAVVHSREEFLWCKATWQEVEDDVERAARWYYMISSSFGNIGRAFARATKSNSQTGSLLRNNIRLFLPVHQRLKNVQIENQDWREILRDFDNHDAVFYLDPPYVEYTGGCYKHTMTVRDHRELCERVFQLDGFVALSGYKNDIYKDYEWDNILDWEVNVSMTGLAFTKTNGFLGMENHIERGNATEMLWIKEAK